MTSTYLAVFTGSKDNPRMKAWMAMPETERNAAVQKGIAAWKGWMEKHHGVIEGQGGPLGKTKRITANGIQDVSNQMSGYVVIRAESHDAAAALFENHPHFTNFPGEGVEVMPVMPIPAG